MRAMAHAAVVPGKARGRAVRRWAGALLPTVFLAAPVLAEQAVGPLAAILGRSFERQTARTILGRSVSVDLDSRTRRPVTGGTMPGSRLRPYGSLIQRYSREHGLDVDLVSAVILAESGGDEAAVSSRGAAGLMQLMPDTAADMGATDLFDPEDNIASGTRYLRSLLDRFGTVEVALWAYNAGPGAVEKGRMPAETRTFVPRVLRLRQQLRASRSE